MNCGQSLKRSGTTAERLAEFHNKIADLAFLDPACGCGNFLVITYRELRLLELEILRQQNQSGQGFLDIGSIVKLDITSFYGIEIDEWAARIAEVAMWLMDHQMNMMVSEEFGQYFNRLPLASSANIVNGNALRMDWEEVVSKNELNFIIGNPPFVGAKYMSKEQKEDMKKVAGSIKSFGLLDFVAAWYILTIRFIQSSNIKAAFVSTNSVCQGEQVGILWKYILESEGGIINFAHRTFQWNSESRKKAAVHVVIVGFSKLENTSKLLFDYEELNSEPLSVKALNINGYLVNGINIFLSKRRSPTSNIPIMKFGNQPIDGGYFSLDENEKDNAIDENPELHKYIRKYVGSYEFINNVNRYCLWLSNVPPDLIRKNQFLKERINAVKKFRLGSKREATRDLANFPTRFAFISHQETEYIIIPSVSSIKRKYVPIGFMSKDVIASNLCLIIPGANLFHFGILTSAMHMTWLSYVGGKLKSDYRYSASLVYNNFPWPKSPTDKQKETVEAKAQAVLDARALYPDSSLADLYDPLTMPPELVKAHQALDKAVDKCYRPQPFPNERKRIEFLFELYAEYTEPLLGGKK
jgi:hypothetical protein